ncbi:MAG TPA: hypothetical protein VH475_27925, partial [Tepidisphaeraceae bacterium]
MARSNSKPARRDPLGVDRPRANLAASRGAFAAVFALIVVLVIVMYAQERWLAVVSVALFDGGLVVAWVVSAWLLGAAIVRGIGLPLRGALGFATAAATGMGAMSLAALGLGLAGTLNRWSVLAILLAGPALTARWGLGILRTARTIQVGRWLAGSAGWRWLLIGAAPMVGMMMVGASITPGLLWKPEDPHPYDALEYHLQVPREWFDAGRITGLHNNVFSYFPSGVEMHFLMAMHLRGGPWAAMYACQFFSIAWVLLMAAAVYGAVRRDGDAEDGSTAARTAVASAAAVVVLAAPWSVMLGSVAYAEGGLALYTGLAAAWMLRAVGRGETRGRAMLVAGAMVGFACGVKYTAVPMVLLALGITAVVVALATRRLREWWKGLLVYSVVAVAVASPWYVRNAVWTRNPVFPLAMNTLGRAHFDEVQVERFRIAHSPPPAERPLGARLLRA